MEDKLPVGNRAGTCDFNLWHMEHRPEGYFYLWNWGGAVNTTATSAQECIDTAYSANNRTLGIRFNSATGDCGYATVINSYWYQATGAPEYYVRADGILADTSSCMTQQDAEYLLMKLSFPNDAECPPGFSVGTIGTSGSFCVSTTVSTRWGAYNAVNNGTKIILTRSQVLSSIGYQCPNPYDFKMIFNGTWYCYPKQTVAAGSVTTMAAMWSACSASSSKPIVISEYREYAWLFWMAAPEPVYVGLVLQSGTTFTWYDSSPATGLPWASGRPNNTGGNNTLAYVSSGIPPQITDSDSSKLKILVCKTPATSVPYDPTAKFSS